MKFVDQVSFVVASGHGGPGLVAFHRAKYVPRGGPNGGDGGRGGSVTFEATTSRNTLVDFRFNKVYRGGDGQKGGQQQMTGADGADLLLYVPVGTVISDDLTDELLADLSEPGAQFSLAGGRGGKGNYFFRTATMQTPRHAQPGEPGIEVKVRLELKLIADVGLLGFPNAGKSTLISVVSAARPKIADYPFTTLVPNLGVVQVGIGESFVVADIPGLIEGAAEGAGLGHRFLQHVERCPLLVHLVAADPTPAGDVSFQPSVGERLRVLNAELQKYDPEVASRPQIVCLSQVDTVDDTSRARQLAELSEAAGQPALALSAKTGEGVRPLVYRIWSHIGSRSVEAVESDDSSR